MSEIEEILNKFNRVTESQKIQEDLYKETPMHKSQLCGIAYGYYFLYDILNQYEKKGGLNDLSISDFKQIIKTCASSDEVVNGYFLRLLKDLK